jgi:hypothetical protein
MADLTLLTPTGCRPSAWAICERLMARQTYTGSVRWVVVDDGETAQPITFMRRDWALDVVRPTPHWRPGQNTQARNLAAGLAEIGADERVAIIEDDDYYGAGYLADVARWLDDCELVGEGFARYFNVATGRGAAMENAAHASLCSTAVRGHALERLRRVVASGEKWIDLALWRSCQGAIHRTQHVVGIKGLPGRGGIGAGHRPAFGVHRSLRDWIGNEESLYV